MALCNKMNISEGARTILNTIAEKANRSTSTSVIDKAVIDGGHRIPPEEVHSYLNQLEGLGLIKRGPKASGADFRMINITREGLEATSSTQDLR